MVKDIMQTDVVTVHPDTTLREAAQLMETWRHRSLPVVDAESTVLGIVSESVLLRIMLPGYTDEIADLSFLPETYDFPTPDLDNLGDIRVQDIMEHETLQTVTEDMRIAEVAHIMLSQSLPSVIVVREGKLVGIVSRRDLVRALVHPKLGIEQSQ